MSKVFQCFSKVRHNFVRPESFAKVIEATNCTGLWGIDILQMLLVGFASMASESTVLGPPDLAWSSSVLQPERNFLNYRNLDQLRLHLSLNKCLLVASVALWPTSNSWNIISRIRLCCTFIGAAFKSHTMHNVSAHQLLRYYQPQWILCTAWTASVMWYIHCKVARTTKILQNFWLILVFLFNNNHLFAQSIHV